ncbi:MAG: carboxypeptidase regulatory-like domain-containing protein [Planctomycetes bacterium]|nr:carboxypeptidase regulatory-like domain-containing protein [Planctomycetota bacterium]
MNWRFGATLVGIGLVAGFAAYRDWSAAPSSTPSIALTGAVEVATPPAAAHVDALASIAATRVTDAASTNSLPPGSARPSLLPVQSAVVLVQFDRVGEQQFAATLGIHSVSAEADKTAIRLIEPWIDSTIVFASPGDHVVLGGDGVQLGRAVVEERHLDGHPLSLRITARARLCGTVSCIEQDAPISGATLLIESEALTDSSIKLEVNSSFDVLLAAPPPWTVTAFAPGRCPSRRIGVDPREPLAIRLAIGVRQHGRVVSEDGTPIAGAALTVGRFGSIPVDEQAVGTSDADGKFELDAAPCTEIVVSARRDGFAPARLEVSADAAGSAPIELVLPLETRFTGSVVDEHGAPVARARVLVGSLSDHLVVGAVATDADGRFSMPWVAGGHEYHIEASAPGFAPVDRGPFVAPCDSLLIALHRLPDVSLFVCNESGAPISGATVAACTSYELVEHQYFAAAMPTRIATSDHNGRATLLSLPLLPHLLVVGATAYGTQIRRWSPDSVASIVDIALQRAADLEVRWVDASARPLAGIRITRALELACGTWTRVPAAATAESAADGTAKLSVSEGEASAFLCERDGFAPLLRRVRVGAIEATWQWPECGEIELCLPASYTARANALHLLATHSEHGTIATRIGVDGRCRIDGLAAGPIRLRLFDEWSSSYWHCNAAAELSAVAIAGITTTVVWPGTGGIDLVGRVEGGRRDASRCTVVALAIERPGEPSRASSLELDGRFVFPGLLPGRWRIVACAERGASIDVAEAEILLSDGAATPILSLDWSRRERKFEAWDARSQSHPADAVVECVAGDGIVLGRAALAKDCTVAIQAPEGSIVRVRTDTALGRGSETALATAAAFQRLLVRESATLDVVVLDRDGRAAIDRAVLIRETSANGVIAFAALTNRFGHVLIRVGGGRHVVSCGAVEAAVELFEGETHRATLRLE